MKAMKKWFPHKRGPWAVVILAVLAMAAVLAGCQRSTFRVSMVIEGQKAPHDGYNIGPELYVNKGQPVKVSGALVWVRGLDPNDME